MSAAQKALLKLDEEDPHTKNWRFVTLTLTVHNCSVSEDGHSVVLEGEI